MQLLSLKDRFSINIRPGAGMTIGLMLWIALGAVTKTYGLTFFAGIFVGSLLELWRNKVRG